MDNEEYDKFYRANEARAEKYYQELLAALKREDVEYLEKTEDRDDIDWTELSQATLDKIEDIDGEIGEYLEKRRSGEL